MFTIGTTPQRYQNKVLAFCTRTLPAGRAFSRRLYLATAKAKKTHQLNKVTKEMTGPSVFFTSNWNS
jgi:hypothetical protein